MENQKSTEINRRSFLKSGAVVVASLAVAGTGVGLINKVNASDLRRENILRPPGAVDENDFIYGCIKCGLCVQICPVNAVKLAGISQGLSYGTPYIDVRNQPCDFSCDSLQCVETCPTAVLDFKQFKNIGEKAIIEYEKTRDRSDPEFNPFKVQIVAMREAVTMGMARLIPGTCLAVKGQGFTGTPRGDDFDGVHRSPARGRGRGMGLGQGKGRGPGGGGRHRRWEKNDVEEHDGEGRYKENVETKASPLSERHFDREICDLCVTECPIGCEAIEMVETEQPDGSLQYTPQVNEGCTGCGVCVMVCPTQKPSIVVEPWEGGDHV
jgi:ferredoxin-type protein NapG